MTSDEVTNKEIRDLVKHLFDEKETLLHMTQRLSPEEVEALKSLAEIAPVVVQIAEERKAFAIVFSKGKMVIGMFSGVILFLSSFLVDWSHLKNFFKVGG